MTALLVALAVVSGLAIGSFLTTTIYRVPAKLPVLRPPACPDCAAHIEALDQVPVLSWFLLRGRCRACEARISVRYPFVEVLTAAVFVGVAFRFGWSWTLPPILILMAGLVALSFVDYDHLLLPRAIVYPVGGAVVATLILAAVVQAAWHRLLIALACAAVEFALLYAINRFSPRSLGFGDVRLGPVIAVALGWLGWDYALAGFVAANLVGALIGVVLITTHRAGRNTPVPFGVFLAIGAFIAIFAGGALH